jgi:hypothetical protein
MTLPIPTPIPLTDAFKVNTWVLGGQSLPSTAVLSDGSFVVTWETNYADGSVMGIAGQRFAMDGTPVGTEFLVNSFTNGDQRHPAVAALADGGYVITWHSQVQDGGGWGVFAQRYTASGAKAGSELQVNTYTNSDQQDPTVVGLSDGSFIIAWESLGQDGAGAGIYGQRYSTSGSAIGTEFKINSYTPNEQNHVDLTALANGGFLAVWQSQAQDGYGGGIYAQSYGADGSTVGGEFKISTAVANQQYPDVAKLADGRLVVTWQSHNQDGSAFGIYGQLLNADGTLVGGEFRANTFTTGDQRKPSVAALSDGGFIVTWESEKQIGSSWDIFGQRYGADGTRIGNEFLINTTTVQEQWNTSVTGLPNGTFVVTWQDSEIDGSTYGIAGRLFEFTEVPPLPTTPIPLTDAFKVNTWVLGGQSLPSTAVLSDGSFVVTWETNYADGSVMGIAGQRFAMDGTPVGTEFLVNSFTNGDQRHPAVAALADGGYVITWHSQVQDGGGWGVFAQRYTASGAKAGSELQVNTYTNSDQQDPTVVGLSDGSFIIAWESLGQDGAGAGIYGQRYSTSGSAIGTEFKINSYTPNEQNHVDLTALANGGFLAVWQSQAQDGYGGGIYAQSYGADGSTVGGEFKISTAVANQQYPDVAKLADGRLVVTWQSHNQDGSAFGIYGQLLNADGTLVGGEFRANTFTTGDQRKPSVAALSDGGFIVTWESEKQIGSSWDIFGQRYGADGTRIGNEFLINTTTVQEQWNTSVTGLPNGTFVVTWQDSEIDGSTYGIAGRVFSISAAAQAEQPLSNALGSVDQFDLSALYSPAQLPASGGVGIERAALDLIWENAEAPQASDDVLTATVPASLQSTEPAANPWADLWLI